jgi:beta-galactosidase
MNSSQRPHHLRPSILFASLFALFACAATGFAADRLTLNFNPDWRFIKDDPAGAQAPGFDDTGWTAVSAPHTYNDIDTFDNWSTPGHRGEQIQWGGRTWYRKKFIAPPAWQGKKVFIEFEAARQVAEVYLNGHLLGVSKTGFTPFGFDLTPHLSIGVPNVLAVMVDNRFMKDRLEPAATGDVKLTQVQGEVNQGVPDRLEDLQADQIPWNNPHWHPAHGGLYRNVRLYVTDPLHISLPLYSFLATTGPYAYASAITSASAKVTVEVPVQNERTTAAQVDVQVRVLDAEGRAVLASTRTEPIAAGGKATITLSGALTNPRLWEPDYPHVYRIVCSLRIGNTVIDTSEVPLGIRAPHWDVSQGFFINGYHLKLHGWGQKPTNEWPGLGAALPDWLQFYTLTLMKEAGSNFIRWGHCAAGPTQINAGDRLGIIADQPGVDGESDTVKAAWQLRVMAFRDTVIYFRNNPSILVWEGGNQKVTREHAHELRALMDQYDPHGGRAYAHRRADAITAEVMDIGVGTEGGREISALPVFEGEYDREESPRRVWDDASPPNFGYPEAKGMTYQLTSEQFAVNQVSQYVKKLGAPEHSGGANWIFSDSTSGGRVPAEVARAGGEVDGVRLPKEAYFVVSTMFRAEPQVHIIGHWSYPAKPANTASTAKDVFVASNAESVELFVNGKSLGTGARSDTYLFTFKNVAFEPGEIKAVASTEGKVVATQTKHTVGTAVGLKLTAITAPGGLRADGSDIALVDVEAVDAKGERVPTFQQRVDFETDGPGVWRGGYNSGKLDSINHPFLDLEAGINRVAIRATRTAGIITVRARSAGLTAGSVTILASPFRADDGFSSTPPAAPPEPLPSEIPQHSAFTSMPPLTSTTASADKTATGVSAGAGTGAAPGRFITRLNYSGPASIVHVETNARDGRNVYVDRDYVFASLQADLVGADWIQLADADARYSAVDLIELSVKRQTLVTIAYDARAPVPEWLAKQFEATGRTLVINGQSMTLFSHRVDQDGSLTLGANNEHADGPDAHMYIVLASAPR